MTLEQFKVVSMLALATMVVLFLSTVFVIYYAEKRMSRRRRAMLNGRTNWRLRP